MAGALQNAERFLGQPAAQPEGWEAFPLLHAIVYVEGAFKARAKRLLRN
jgi:hypothetical protein